MNGEHEVRLERIERSLADLHRKVDSITEIGMVNEVDILWLKWSMRLLLAGMLGGGGLTTHTILGG